MTTPIFFFFKLILVHRALTLTILFYKITFCPLNIIIDSFKSTILVTNFSITFLQIVEVLKFYWFASRPITYIIFLLINNYSPH